MQILISVIINIIILAVALPLFYIYIVSRARERLERETTSKAREEIEALVKEFNNIALSRISILEDAINRADELLKKINIDNQDNNNEVKSKNHTNNLNIKIEDIENKIENKESEIQIIENKNDNIENQKTINENIIKLYKEGFSKEEISKKLNCAITEIDIVIDMENIKK